MAKLQVNDDGTITFPLRGRDPLTLDEPSMADLAWLTGEVQRVDASLPELPRLTQLPKDPTPEQITAQQEAVEQFNDANRQRTIAVYDPEEGPPPYGGIVIELIKRATDGAESVDASQL